MPLHTRARTHARTHTHYYTSYYYYYLKTIIVEGQHPFNTLMYAYKPLCELPIYAWGTTTEVQVQYFNYIMALAGTVSALPAVHACLPATSLLIPLVCREIINDITMCTDHLAMVERNSSYGDIVAYVMMCDAKGLDISDKNCTAPLHQ